MLARALRRAGRGVRSVQAASPSTPRSSRSTRRRRRADGGGRGRPRAAPGGRPMIRINLLAVERERGEGRGALIPPAQRVTIGAAPDPARDGARHRLVVLVAAAGSRRGSTRTSPGPRRETQQLRSVLAQVQKFEARKAQLQQRVTLIEQLRRGQTGAGARARRNQQERARSAVARPMTQKGNDFTIDGMTTSLTALSDFVANLEASAWFKKPVEIVDSQVQPDAKAGDLFSSRSRRTFKNPDAPPPRPRRPGADARRRGRGSSSAKGAVGRSDTQQETHGTVAQQTSVVRPDRRVRRRVGARRVRLLELLRDGSAGRHRCAADAADRAAGRHRQGRRDRAPAAAVPGAGHRARSGGSRTCARCCRRRRTSPTSCAGSRAWRRSRT